MRPTKLVLLLIALLAGRLLVTLAAAAPASIQSRIDRLLDGQMPIGFYIYLYDWKQARDTSQHDLDDALEDMARRGFNYLYVGGVGPKDATWERVLEFCGKHKIAVVPQLDFAYLSSPTQNADPLVARAVPFIRKYKDHPALLAFSVNEEPSAALMPVLKRYFEGILREVPDAPLHLLHNQLGPLKESQPPFPGIIGTDRYPFWWEFGSGGHRATPSYALNWYRSQMSAYYDLATARKAEFQAVFTASTLETHMSAQRMRQAFYPASIPDRERDQYLHNAQNLAKNKNQGWDQSAEGRLWFWKYYRPPTNCTLAMAWLAVLEGARSQAIWAWSPPRQDMKDFAHRVNGQEDKEYTCGITGWDGKGTPQLEEYTRFAREIRPCGRLIRSMIKKYTTEDKNALTPAIAPPVAIGEPDVRWRCFGVEGFKGQVLLIVNTRVGQWCDGRNPQILLTKDVFRMDDFGNLIDYKAFDAPRDVKVQIRLEGVECMDMSSGSIVPLGDAQSTSLSILPGAGRFIFLSPKNSGEWARLKKLFGL